jgi:hypothetical protein
MERSALIPAFVRRFLRYKIFFRPDFTACSSRFNRHRVSILSRVSASIRKFPRASACTPPLAVKDGFYLMIL